MGFLQAGMLEWVAISFSRDLLNPGIKPTSPAWQTDSLPLSHLGSPSFVVKHWNLSLIWTIRRDIIISRICRRPQTVSLLPCWHLGYFSLKGTSKASFPEPLPSEEMTLLVSLYFLLNATDGLEGPQSMTVNPWVPDSVFFEQLFNFPLTFGINDPRIVTPVHWVEWWSSQQGQGRVSLLDNGTDCDFW